MDWSQPGPSARTAGVVMQFGPVTRGVVILLLVVVLGVLLAASLRGRDSMGLRIWASLAALALAACAVEVIGVSHRLVPGGIERVAPLRSRVLVRWSDVAAIEWSARTRWFEVRRRDGEVVRIYGQLTGLRSFARAALEGVPAGVLDATSGIRQRLEQHARGIEPRDQDPEREEWRSH